MAEQSAADLAFRVRAVEFMKSGENITKLSREMKVSRFTLYRWKEIYEKHGPAGLALGSQGRPLLGKAKGASCAIGCAWNRRRPKQRC